MWPQLLTNGLMTGFLYGILGTGFVVQWGIGRIINLAYGSFLLIGAYVVFALTTFFKVNPLVLIIPAGICGFVLGWITYEIIFRLAARRGLIMTLVAGFGLDLVLINIMLLIWKADTRTITVYWARRLLALGTVRIGVHRLLIAGVGILCVVCLWAWLKWSRKGKTILALASNPFAAEIVGIHSRATARLAFSLGGMLAGVGGALFGMVSSFSPTITGTLLSKVFIVAVLGGLGNIWSSLAGGIVLGLAEALGSRAVGAAYSEALGLMLMLAVLILRPRGIMGRAFWE
jgi:branched-chain amino acid transport system permease protein